MREQQVLERKFFCAMRVYIPSKSMCRYLISSVLILPPIYPWYSLVVKDSKKSQNSIKIVVFGKERCTNIVKSVDRNVQCDKERSLTMVEAEGMVDVWNR